MTREPAGYGSPGAFRRALTDRLRAIAAEGRWALPQLQRQFAYDRLLERLYAVDDGWIVKGAADKVVAIFQLYGEQRRPSTRYKDLVDLVSIATGASVSTAPQLTALASEAERRGIVLPARFDIPDRALWEPGYAAEAARSLLPVGRTLTEALAIVGALVDPLLDKTAAGTWDPNAGRWRS